MSTIDDFYTKKNITLCAELLQSTYKISILDYESVYNQEIGRIYAEKGKYRSLVEMNKHLLSKMSTHISGALSVATKETPITYEDRMKHRRNDFETQLRNREEEFKWMHSKPLPANVEFKENIEDRPLENIDSILEKRLKERDLEIMQVLPAVTTSAIPTYVPPKIKIWNEELPPESLESDGNRSNNNGNDKQDNEKQVKWGDTTFIPMAPQKITLQDIRSFSSTVQKGGHEETGKEKYSMEYMYKELIEIKGMIQEIRNHLFSYKDPRPHVEQEQSISSTI